MNSKELTRQNTGKNHKLARREGSYVQAQHLHGPGICVYVPSPDELRACAKTVRPFQGRIMNAELDFASPVSVGDALPLLIHAFGLPNAPEYHDWSEEFFMFKREGTEWQYVFVVNGIHHLFVSHHHNELMIGCKGTLDMTICREFARFIEKILAPR